MNLENIINFSNNDCKTVQVVFQSCGKRYTYLTDEALKVNDWVVVDTERGLQVVAVVHVDDDCDIDIQDPIKFKWIVCKIDMSTYSERIKDINYKVRALRKQQRQSIARQTLESMNISYNEEPKDV